MSELTEKEPRLKRITDAAGRDLLQDVYPLEANPPAGASVAVVVRVENGLEGLIDLTVTSDREWLRPRSDRLSLMGGETAPFEAVVDATGAGEFANLCFAWTGTAETYREYVLVWRKGKTPVAPPPPPVPPPPRKPAGGVTKFGGGYDVR